MLIDLLALVLLVLALIKGWQRGLIVGFFSLVAVIIGLAAAMKLSVVVADYLGKSVSLSKEWLPLLAFALVFIGVVLLIRLGAIALQKATETLLLGWLNRAGGILLYLLLYALVFSVVLFYAVQLQWLTDDTLDKSHVYPYLRPWGPRVINGLGQALPFFRDMFADLQDFFGRVAETAPPAPAP